jgi:hypothetical protein
MHNIQIKMPDKKISLSPGKPNILIKKIIDDFCPRFTPDAEPLYIKDTGRNSAYFDKQGFSDIGIDIDDQNAKIPDVIVHYMEKDWLVIIGTAAAYGPINIRRKIELDELFKTSKIGIVYVTAFLDRKGMLQYFNEIAWETEVWVDGSPSHLIHFNGKRFLGPYVK